MTELSLVCDRVDGGSSGAVPGVDVCGAESGSSGGCGGGLCIAEVVLAVAVGVVVCRSSSRACSGSCGGGRGGDSDGGSGGSAGMAVVAAAAVVATMVVHAQAVVLVWRRRSRPLSNVNGSGGGVGEGDDGGWGCGECDGNGGCVYCSPWVSRQKKTLRTRRGKESEKLIWQFLVVEYCAMQRVYSDGGEDVRENSHGLRARERVVADMETAASRRLLGSVHSRHIYFAPSVDPDSLASRAVSIVRFARSKKTLLEEARELAGWRVFRGEASTSSAHGDPSDASSSFDGWPVSSRIRSNWGCANDALVIWP
eukprot:1534564-Pleurochrysis_carterae.AAC.4